MPSRNRFSPSFSERLTQSRVARGLEQAPEPRPTHHVNATSWGLLIDEYREQLRNNMALWQQEFDLAPSLDRPRHDPSAPVPIPHPDWFAAASVSHAPKPVPERKEPQQMNQQTEQTVITCLQQGVADAIYFLSKIRDGLRANGTKVTSPRLEWRPAALEGDKGSELNATAMFRCEFANSLYLMDEFRPMAYLDTYPYRAVVVAANLVMRHVAVINAIDDLLKVNRSMAPKDRENLLADLRTNQIDDFEAYFDSDEEIFASRTAPSVDSSTRDLPQLRIARDMIYGVRQFTNSHDCQTFGPRTPLWKVREQLRMAQGEYTPLPDEVLALLPQDVIDIQFPHVATKPSNAGMIAYTQSPIAGMLDRQQVIKPGRYIRQHNADISDEQVKQAAAACVAASSAGFHHSKDPEDFARIYINGPSSCMAYDETGKDFSRLFVNGEFFHPAKVYAHPDNDIEIVWLEVAGRIAARAVINTANKSYPRVYGSDSVSGAYNRLEEYLEGLGYCRRDGALQGQKLLKVHPDRFPGAIICPYIDSTNLGVEVYDSYLIAGGDESADHETGCLERYNTKDEYDWICDCCGDGQSEDDARYETNDNDDVCESCVSRHYTRVWSVPDDYSRYVSDNETFYSARYTPFSTSRPLWFDGDPDDYGYVELCSAYYNDNYVAPEDDCVQDEDGDWVRRIDVDDHNLFINEDNDVAYCIGDWAVLDGELVNRHTLDDDAERSIDTDDTYPMLPVYNTIEQEEVA